MYNLRLNKTILAVFVSLNFGLTPTSFAANSGGKDLIDYDNFAGIAYIGIDKNGNYASTFGNVYIDSTVGDNITQKDVIGGYSKDGNATYNTVTITGGTVFGYLSGGESYAGNATYNSVIMTDGTISKSLYGGYSKPGSVAYNVVTMTGGTVSDALYGGWSNSNFANYNTSIMTGGTVSKLYGGWSNNNSANYNTVIMNGGTVLGTLYGGWSNSSFANYNTVTISGGTINANISGGAISDVTPTGTATYNTVNIFGNPTFAATSQIYGGSGGNSVDVRTGNRLNIFTSGIEVKNILNFQHYNFVLPTDGKTVLKLTDNTDFGGTASTINLPYALSGKLLKAGDTVTIVQNPGGLNNLPTLKDGIAQQGFGIIYDYNLQSNTNNITATINNVRANPKAKTLSENRAANLGILTSGADLVASSGVANAVSSIDNNNGFVPFGVMNSDNLRYNSGSHIDVKGTRLLTGLAYKSGSITLGYFIEGGWSNYDTFNDDNNNANGDANYYGLGMLFKKQLKNNTYLDASIRLGQIKSNFVNTTFTDMYGNYANYKTNSLYYSAHIGYGKTHKINKNQELDLFARYLFTHQNGNNITLSGDQFNFKAINSNRLQLGTKYTFGKTQNKNYYLGLTYEYEMSGVAKASVYGFDLPSPSLKGSSGILELGMQITTSDKSTIDIGLQGYTGKRKGFSGSVSANFKL